METQRIALFGATTKVGERILQEALSRGHKVTAITPNPEKLTTTHPQLEVVTGDLMNRHDIGSKLKGHDVVISAYESRKNPTDHVLATKALIQEMKSAGVKHLISTGHPGSSEVDPTIAQPANPEAWKAVADAQQKVLDEMDNVTEFHWSYVHYPEIQDKLDKSGKPALGNEMLIKNRETEQRFPVRQHAQTVLNEAEHFTEAHTEP